MAGGGKAPQLEVRAVTARPLGRPVHPLLLAALPVVSAYAAEAGANALGEVLTALVVTVAGVALGWGVFSLTLRTS